jgi:CubicO group peptidase (beta-lactamase class C family)
VARRSVLALILGLGGFACLSLVVWSSPQGLAPGASSSVAGFAEEVDRLGSAGEFSGAVLVARGNAILYEAAYGLADRTLGVPNTLDTRFNLASLDKMFTGVAVMQLVERGLLSLEMKVGDILPDYSQREVASQVTIHQLLTHTSGLGDYFTSPFLPAGLSQLDGLDDYLALFADEPLLFPPGSATSYSNSGCIVLGLIVERVSGMSYYDFVRENIFLPAGMAVTGSFAQNEDFLPRAIGYYTDDAGALCDNGALLPMRGGSGGGGYSTAGDLFRFARALLEHRLLSPETTGLTFLGKAETRNPEMMFAYGFMDRMEAGHRVVGHGGGFAGVANTLNMYLESGYAVVVLSNMGSGTMTLIDYLAEHPLE